MTWINENYGKVTLLAVSIAVAGTSAWLILQSHSFDQAFEGLKANVARGEKLPALPFENLDRGLQMLDKPSEWTEPQGASLFVSDPYLVQEVEGQQVLINPLREDSKPIHPPVPNKWFQTHQLEILSPNILDEDTDNDGFSNKEEWSHNTNPRDPKSTPPPHILLSLVAEEKKPVRLIFKTDLGETYQINALDSTPRSQSVPKGEMIKGTKFKVVGYEQKTETRDIGGSVIEKDISELTIENIENGEKITLIKDVIFDVGDSVAILKMRGDPTEIRLKRNQEFTLPPNKDRKYRLAEVGVEGASILDVESGKRILVPRAAAQEPSLQ